MLCLMNQRFSNLLPLLDTFQNHFFFSVYGWKTESEENGGHFLVSGFKQFLFSSVFWPEKKTPFGFFFFFGKERY